jgi:hypothetical protein
MPTLLLSDPGNACFAEKSHLDVPLGTEVCDDTFEKMNMSFRSNVDERFLPLSLPPAALARIPMGYVDTSLPAPTLDCIVETDAGDAVALYDSGSCYTAVSVQFVCRYNQRHDDRPLIMTPALGLIPLYTALGTKIDFLGVVELSFRIAGFPFTCQCYVMDSCTRLYDLILGRNFWTRIPYPHR